MKTILINTIPIIMAFFMMATQAHEDQSQELIEQKLLEQQLIEQQIELRGVCVYICDQTRISVEIPEEHKCHWRYDGEASKPAPIHQESGALAIVAELLGKAETYYQTTGEQLNFLTKWTYDGVCSEKRNEA